MNLIQSLTSSMQSQPTETQILRNRINAAIQRIQSDKDEYWQGYADALKSVLGMIND